jgi:serine/threonine protein kinase/tetratricopeptide (TPR) repeat protein
MIAPAGRKLGKYEIRQKLGRGGMADVYLAQDTELGEAIALKLIEHGADADTTDAIAAERRGAVLQAQLAAIDPRVVRVYDSGDLDGFFYVGMEYVDGQDLAELMRHGPLSTEFAADVAIAVAETLEHAHTLDIAIDGKRFQGIVHGDIKPKNIRVDSHGEVRVLDFGIAKALSLSRRLTRNEFGSVPYASPERLDLGEVNVLSDLWSLAVMLYEMVTGLQPYHAESTERLERMIRSRIPPPPAPDPCPESLRRILIKAMAPAPEMRYQTAADFAGDLIAFRKGEAVEIPALDLDATRRTFPRRDEDSDVTRRTDRSLAVAAQSGGSFPSRDRQGAVQGFRKPPVFGRFVRAIGVVALLSLLYGSWLVISEYLLYEHGQQLERDVETEQVTDLDQIWNRWTELSKGHVSSWLLWGPRRLVKQKFEAAADHVISTYRDDAQQVYEKDWERARTMAARALAVDPGDATRGKLRLCEGHLARINGTAHGGLAELNRAVDDFYEAQRLMPKSPDPELGLARVYVYGLKDIDRAYQALQQAGKLGYPLGKREKSQLADGYRARADRVWWDSRNVRGLPQERDEIQRAEEDYKRALQIYQEIAPYGNANVGIVRVQTSMESLDSRLQQIADGSGN